jgi:hypothetical protein
MADLDFAGLMLAIGAIALLSGLAFLHFSTLWAIRRELTRELTKEKSEVEEKSIRERKDIWRVHDLEISRLKEENTREADRRRDIEEQMNDALPYLKNVIGLADSIREMSQIWLVDAGKDARPAALSVCSDLFLRNDWVLWPDYAADALKETGGALRIVQNVFGVDPPIVSPGASSSETEVFSLFGWANADAALHRYARGGPQEVLLLIGLKPPDVSVDQSSMAEACVEACRLMNIGKAHLDGRPIECLLIGGEIEPGAENAKMQLGSDIGSVVHVTSLTYGEIFNRAQLLTQGLLNKAGTEQPVVAPTIEPVLDAGAKSHPPAELAVPAQNDEAGPGASPTVKRSWLAGVRSD